MARECPYCRQSDLLEAATKCHHCGSWLEESKHVDEFEAFRRDVHQRVSEDLAGHRTLIEKLLTRMQIFAGVIAAVAGGFAVYFTGVTKENITETTSRIEETAATQVKNAADQATLRAIELVNDRVRDQVGIAVREKLDAPDTRALIEQTMKASIASSVQDEVASQFTTIRMEVADETDAAREKLGALTAEIEGVRQEALVALDKARDLTMETRTAVSAVDSVKVFANAEYQQFASSTDVDLQFQIIRASDKGGLDRIPELAAGKVNALTFELGSGAYWGPVAWKYVEWLSRNPQFQYVVLLENGSDRALGYWQARTLAATLNPPNNSELVSVHAGLHDLPSETEIERWMWFAEAVNSGEHEELEELPGFRSMENAMQSVWSNRRALDHMLAAGADSLPVIDEADRLVGVADRSRLTTHMLLQIAERP